MAIRTGAGVGVGVGVGLAVGDGVGRGVGAGVGAGVGVGPAVELGDALADGVASGVAVAPSDGDVVGRSATGRDELFGRAAKNRGGRLKVGTRAQNGECGSSAK